MCPRPAHPAATELLIATAKSLERVAVVPMDVPCAQWGVHPTTLEPLSPTAHDAKGLLLPMAGQPGRCVINQFKTKAYLGSKCGVCPRMSAALTTVQVCGLQLPSVQRPVRALAKARRSPVARAAACTRLSAHQPSGDESSKGPTVSTLTRVARLRT
jgi:hypothetical protein